MNFPDYEKWQPLSEKAISNVPSKPGVYIVRHKNIAVGRLLDSDTTGILYFGQSGKRDLKTRLKELFKDAIGQVVNKHPAGWWIRYIVEFDNRFGTSSMEFRYRVFPTENETKKEESELLNRYVRRFGELPPFNARWD